VRNLRGKGDQNSSGAIKGKKKKGTPYTKEIWRGKNNHKISWKKIIDSREMGTEKKKTAAEKGEKRTKNRGMKKAKKSHTSKIGFRGKKGQNPCKGSLPKGPELGVR